MPQVQTPKMSKVMQQLIQSIHAHQDDIQSWLESLETGLEFPFYSSVDIRDSGFKTVVVDTNLYPAGFNNLCSHSLHEAVKFFRSAILKRHEGCQHILLVIEEHTRNTWYFENARVLQNLLIDAGFNVRMATFLEHEEDFSNEIKYVDRETSTGQMIRIYCFRDLIKQIEAGIEKIDFLLINNDLINGIPDILENSKIMAYPSIHAGWHSRRKSNHFHNAQELLDKFAAIIKTDPWLLSCLNAVVDSINVNEENHRIMLYEAAEDLLLKIKRKYAEHGITEKPYLVIKADAGTYGMGVLTIEDLSEIKEMHHKERRKLHTGKGTHEIHRYLIQEGVQTIHHLNNEAAEVCLYQIEENFVGSFYRINSIKDERGNLNSKGMHFEKICSHKDHFEEQNVHAELSTFDLYRILGRIAAIAAHQEIVQLEREIK